MRKVLGPTFFNRPALVVARDLLGKYLVRRIEGDPFTGLRAREIALMIGETEAYGGYDDLASHSRSGQTKRNYPMFGPPGHAYVYFTYGLHWMLNLVCHKEGYPAGVLIRAAGQVVGPARLTKFLSIDGTLNAKALTKASGLWVEDRGVVVQPKYIQKTPRIGVAYAGVWALKPYRFVLTVPKKVVDSA